jgi:talin
LKTAKALVEDTKALVAGAASNQEQLAVAAQNAVRTIVNLSDAVKNGAVSLTSDNSEAQVYTYIYSYRFAYWPICF